MYRLATLCVLLALAVPPLAAEAASLGYVDMQKVIEESKLGQKARETLKAKFEGKQQAFAEEEKSIRQLQQTLARDQALMSQAELNKKKGEIEGRIQEFQKKAAVVQKELNEEQSRLGGEVVAPAEKVIAALSKEKKLSVVFERRQAGLLYIDEALNLTAEVIKRLDATGKK